MGGPSGASPRARGTRYRRGRRSLSCHSCGDRPALRRDRHRRKIRPACRRAGPRPAARSATRFASRPSASPKCRPRPVRAFPPRAAPHDERHAGIALRHRPPRDARRAGLRLGLGRGSVACDRGGRAARVWRRVGAAAAGERGHDPRRRRARLARSPARALLGLRGDGLRGEAAYPPACARAHVCRRQRRRHRPHRIDHARAQGGAQVARAALARGRRVAPAPARRRPWHRAPHPRAELCRAVARRSRHRRHARAAAGTGTARHPRVRPQHGRRRQPLSANADRRARRGRWNGAPVHVQSAHARLSSRAPRAGRRRANISHFNLPGPRDARRARAGRGVLRQQPGVVQRAAAVRRMDRVHPSRASAVAARRQRP